MTYSWTQETGNPIAISGANQAVATFTAVNGQSYTFRLTVRNESGLTASARTRVTTTAGDRVQILFFISNPPTIQAGQSSQLSWRVLNATEVTIATIGTVRAEGTASVSPRTTTTYQLTARNGISEENATATVVVQAPQTTITGCTATPTNINAGEAATINFSTTNATSVTVTPNVPGVGTNGSFVVNPTTTTTYTINALGAGNQSVACTVTVTVNSGVIPPRIVRFTATPDTIAAGAKSNLAWQVENADTVTITTLGTVQSTGTQDVTPAQTTTYTLTATNKQGSSTATAVVTVTQPAANVSITSFTANPPVSSGSRAERRVKLPGDECHQRDYRRSGSFSR